MLSNAYFLAKFRFDTAENEPASNLQNSEKIVNFANLELEPTSERAALRAPRAAERGPGRARARGAHRAPPSGTASRRSFSRLSASPLPHSGRLGPQFGVPWTDASVWKMPFSCWPSSTPFSILEIITSTRKFVFGSLQSKEQYVA